MKTYIKAAYAALGKDKFSQAIKDAAAKLQGVKVTNEKDGEFLDVPGTYSHQIAEHFPHVICYVNRSRRKVFALGSAKALLETMEEAIKGLGVQDFVYTARVRNNK